MTPKSVADTLVDLMAAFERYDMRVTGIEMSKAACDALAVAYFYDRRSAPKNNELWKPSFNGADITIRKSPPTPTQRAAQLLREMADKLDKETQ